MNCATNRSGRAWISDADKSRRMANRLMLSGSVIESWWWQSNLDSTSAIHFMPQSCRPIVHLHSDTFRLWHPLWQKVNAKTKSQIFRVLLCSVWTWLQITFLKALNYFGGCEFIWLSLFADQNLDMEIEEAFFPAVSSLISTSLTMMGPSNGKQQM
jgi:hypothetical protein